MKRLAVLTLLLLSAAAVAIRTTRATAPRAPASLTAYVPQDALLSIESPDFHSLLDRWQSSPECSSWLQSDNYAVFQNSHLFGRLADAEDAFSKVAGIPAGTPLLNQIAGTESVFAWYDVGNLEFLYITRMPAAHAAQTELLQARASFSRRHAGKADFYIRTGGNPERTVAFAQTTSPMGDLLLLSTREDLIANALNLIAAGSAASVGPGALAQEPWFVEASAALPPGTAPPALHMVLNLDRIVPLPSFRSYWIQGNVTWMGRYRSAVSDLYLEPDHFREERVLLPRSPQPSPENPPDLAVLAALSPTATGFFRAQATQDAGTAVNILDEKLLGRYQAPAPVSLFAGNPSLQAPSPGTSGDLETRIDVPAPPLAQASDEALRAAIQGSGLRAILTLSSARPPSSLWVPIQSAVVLETSVAIPPELLAKALQASLRGSLTAGNLGIGFQQITANGATLYALTGPQPLFFAVPASRKLVFLANDQALLLSLLSSSPASQTELAPKTDPAPQTEPAAATLIAGFDHASQSAPYARLTSLIDGTNRPPAAPVSSTPNVRGEPGPDARPALFSRDLNSLSASFAPVRREHIVERPAGSTLRQTVTYDW